MSHLYPKATETEAGVQPVATQALTDAGVDDETTITPLKLANYIGLGAPTGPAGGDLAGTYPNPTVHRASNTFSLTNDISPAAISTDQNDYNPAGLSTAAVVRINATTNVNITGIVNGTSDGRILFLRNVSATARITIKNEDAGSTAGNRFRSTTDVIIPPRSGVMLMYDASVSRWLTAAIPASASMGGGRARFTPFSSNASSTSGRHTGTAVGSNASTNFEFSAPNDLVQVLFAYIVTIPRATNTARDIDISVDYGAIGEVKATHQGSDTTSTYDVTADVITGLNFTSILGSLAAGDMVGVEVDHNSIGQSMDYLGILLIYV